MRVVVVEDPSILFHSHIQTHQGALAATDVRRKGSRLEVLQDHATPLTLDALLSQDKPAFLERRIAQIPLLVHQTLIWSAFIMCLL